MAVQTFRVRASVERIKTIAETLRHLTTSIGTDAAERQIAASAGFAHLRDNTGSQVANDTNMLVDQMVRSQIDQELRQQIDRAEQAAIPLVTDLSVHYAFVRESAAAVRPTRDTSNAASILLTKEKWDAVTGALSAGRSFAEIIRRADLAMLTAIEEFAPDYVRLNGIRHFSAEEDDQAVEAILKSITDAVTKRLKEVATSDVAEILSLAHQAEGWHAVALTWVELLRRKVDGDINADPFEYAITETYTLRDFGLAPTPDEINAQRNTDASTAASAGFTVIGARQ